MFLTIGIHHTALHSLTTPEVLVSVSVTLTTLTLLYIFCYYVNYELDK